jgi:DNA processing protein
VTSNIPYLIYHLPEIYKRIYAERLMDFFTDMDSLTDYLVSKVNSRKVIECIQCLEIFKKKIVDANLQVLDYYHPQYPKLLKEIYDPPMLLFYIGNISLLDTNLIAVVGTRKPSDVTLHAIDLLPNYFKKRNIAGVVTGLSPGVEKQTVRIMLKNQVPLVILIPQGLDLFIAQDTYSIFTKRSSDNYLLLSELPPGYGFYRWSYVARNRILTGLSPELLIMEAPEQSGTTSSVNSAISQNREIIVFSDMKQKNNFQGFRWIEDGATSVSLSDFLENNQELVSITDLLPQSYLEISDTLAEISQEEIKGVMKPIGSGYYVKNKKV